MVGKQLVNCNILFYQPQEKSTSVLGIGEELQYRQKLVLQGFYWEISLVIFQKALQRPTKMNLIIFKVGQCVGTG